MFIFYLHLHVYVLRVILVPTIDIGAGLSVKMAVNVGEIGIFSFNLI
jgi:hypothetical protein